MKLTFHGGAETVTGSRTLFEAGTSRLLIDCGLFQGAETSGSGRAGRDRLAIDFDLRFWLDHDSVLTPFPQRGT